MTRRIMGMLCLIAGAGPAALTGCSPGDEADGSGREPGVQGVLATQSAPDPVSLTEADQKGPFSLGLTPTYDSAYGSGSYGKWTKGALGLPAYTFNHTAAAGKRHTAQPPYHMLGNTGAVGHSYADGYHVLFSTRTFPRFANYFRPSRKAFGGGFGYVYDEDEKELWNTYYPTRPTDSSFTTTWGMGYARKNVKHGDVEIVEDTFMPVGDDEVLMQKIVITNHSTTATKKLSYYAYWDWDPYLIKVSFTKTLNDLMPYTSFPYHDSQQEKVGPKDNNKQINYTVSFDSNSDTLKVADATSSNSAGARSEAAFDPIPHTGFFSLLNAKIEAYQTSQTRLFEESDATPELSGRPEVVTAAQKPPVTSARGDDAMFLAQTAVKLAPGESKTLYTLYGMSRNADANGIISKYRGNYASRLEEVIRDYESKLVRFSLPKRLQQDWLSREVAWDSYYLNAGVMYEDFYGTHTVNQNSVYMTGMGQNMSPRDEVQFTLPLIYSNPQMAKEALVHVMKLMQGDGRLTFGNTGWGAQSGADIALRGFFQPFLKPGDLGYWLCLGVAEYVQGTRDFAFLGEKVVGQSRVIDLIARALTYQTNIVGKGKNGLIKIMNADWADGLSIQSGNMDETIARGESTYTTALALAALEKLKAVLQTAPERPASLPRSAVTPVIAAADRLLGAPSASLPTLREALRRQWVESRGFFNRAHLINDLNATKVLGERDFWAESNSFALLVDDPLYVERPSAAGPAPKPLLDAAKIAKLVSVINTEAATDLGINITSKVAPGTRAEAGHSSNPALAADPGNTTWYSLSGAFVRGLAQYADVSEAARALAWTELTRATLANHADKCRGTFYGIISGSDSWDTNLNSSFSKRVNKEPNGGIVCSSWLEEFSKPLDAADFEIALVPPNDPEHSTNNMHSHSHLIASALRLAGVRAAADGYIINPAMPNLSRPQAGDHEFGWESRAFGVHYEDGRVRGKITALGNDTVKMQVTLTPALLAMRNVTVKSDGTVITATRDGNTVRFELKLTQGRTLQWSVEG